MKDIKRKLEQLTHEIKLVKNNEPDTMTGIMIRLEELTELVNKLLIPDVRKSSPLVEGKTKSNVKNNTQTRKLAPPPPPLIKR